MARKRMIDPNIWESEDFSQLSLLGKILFIGMFSLADDEGRGKANPAYIRSKVFPYETEKVRLADIKTALSEIGRSMSVVFYADNGASYYALSNWMKWQKIDKPTPSAIPAPPDKTGVSEQFDEDSSRTSRGLVEDSPRTSRGLAEDSRLNKNKNMNKNMNRKENTHNSARERFPEFWTLYPKKAAKPDAERAWNKLNPDESTVNLIIEDVCRRREGPEWQRENGRYIPHPATYLNQRRWEDETAPGGFASIEQAILMEWAEEDARKETAP